MDTQHARSPAVRARHHLKRLPNSAFEERAGVIGVPEASTGNTEAAAAAGANPPTDSNDNGIIGGIISGIIGGGDTSSTASVPAVVTPSVVVPEPTVVTHSRDPIVTSAQVPNTVTSSSVVAPVTTPSIVSTSSATPSTTTSSSSSSTTPSSSVVPTTSSIPVNTVPDVTDTITGTLSSSSASINPSAGSNVANSTGATSKTSVPGAAIGITVAVLVLGIIAVVVFFVRKHYLRKREMKRQTWGAGVFPRHSEIMVEKPSEGLPVAGVAPAMGGNASTFGAYGAAMGERGSSPSYDLAPPPMSYNSVAPPAPSLAPGNGASPAVAMGRSAAPGPSDALVKCTFIPTLPDELSITTGETVRVVAEYDDGWSLCAKAGGEQGMVPLECLDLAAMHANQQEHSDWRNSRRVSSLPAPRY